MIASGMKSLDIPFLDEKLFRQFTMYFTSNILINFVNFFYGIEWQPHLARSLVFCLDHSMYPMFSFAEHMCRFAGDKKYWMFSNSLSLWKSVMVKPLSCYFDLTCFRPDIISFPPLLLHACTDLKSIFLDFVGVYISGHQSVWCVLIII